jgi:Uma2 family endonuclease
MKPHPSAPTSIYLTPADQGRRLTLEEFESADGLEGYRYELIDGRVEVSPIPNLSHEEVRDWLKGLLDRYKMDHPDVANHIKSPARVFVSDRPETTCPEPDIAAYRDFPHHLPIPERRWQDFSPILVVEVISPDTAAKDLVRNRALYLQVPSIQEYWIVDPRPNPYQPTLHVFRRSRRRWGRPIVVPFEGTYTTPLLPGFSLVVAPFTA